MRQEQGRQLLQDLAGDLRKAERGMLLEKLLEHAIAYSNRGPAYVAVELYVRILQQAIDAVVPQ